ncbi:hydrolase, NUDIX family [Dictyocaulus viviparus]|uniref:Uridine diphosphate glucose pyrophosphatase NUDT14 n=1 Tax=Dictyocaulus viviparus TaxID=29172 RepID=A0A0D8XX89_DICVI|nr:hydrolase, NUDIX family [Dictyocaulus viviparus]
MAALCLILMNNRSSTPLERLQAVSFTQDFVSPFLEGVRLTFTQGTRRRSFDLTLRHSSVAVLLYHTNFKKFLFVRQFRPAVLVGHVLRQPENLEKKLDQINWSNYDASHGYTLELCAGMIDKVECYYVVFLSSENDLSTINIAKEEIEEECGYLVKDEKIHAVATFSVSTSQSGSIQYLFYAEIDDSMKVSEGGGNIHEGEIITKVFLTEDEVLAHLNSDNYCSGSPTMLYALLWWFAHKKGQQELPFLQLPRKSTYKWQPKDLIPLRDFKFEKMVSPKQLSPQRMHFTLNAMTRTWDLALCDDNVCILLFNESKDEVILTQTFRPAALVGQTIHRYSPGIALDSIDWPSQPIEWAYTLEMCSGHYRKGSSIEEIEARVKEIAAVKCGYRVDSIRFIISYIVGISFAGNRERVYYAEVNDSMRILEWSPYEDIIPFSLPLMEISSFIRAEKPTSPPAVIGIQIADIKS